MKATTFLAIPLAALVCGCCDVVSSPLDSPPETAPMSADFADSRFSTDPFAGLEAVMPGTDESSTTSEESACAIALEIPEARQGSSPAAETDRATADMRVDETGSEPSSLPVEGLFVSSGWMGDAEDPAGPLRHEICTEGPFSAPTCDKWIYAAPGDSYEQTWVAVAYQSPANNWGETERGMDLSGKGYTHLTFMARGEGGGERILVRSGGCTTPGAEYPASHEATVGVIVLSKEWRRYDVPLQGCDLSNVCSILSFSINRAMAPAGCTFYLDEIELSSTPD